VIAASPSTYRFIVQKAAAIVNLQISRARRADVRDLAGRDAQSLCCTAAAITVPRASR